MKKVFALILALALIFAMAIPAFAAETVTLTIQGHKSGHTYEAYQIFAGDIEGGQLTHIQWGNGVKVADLVAALKADATLGTLFASASETDPMPVVNVLRSWSNESANLDAFAKIVGEHLNTIAAVSTEGTDNKYSFTLDTGYYLIKDKDSNAELADDFYTKFVITLTSNTDVKVKGSVPTVNKKVSHNLNANYTDKITNQLHKTHYYQWIGSVSSDVSDYDWYWYEFQDTLSAGLTFLQFEQIFIQHVGDVKTMIYDRSQADPVIKAEYMPDVMTNVGQEVTVKWEDLVQKYPTLLPSDKIVVRYSAKLNSNAVIGNTGNPNDVDLIYSNNPQDEEDKGRTTTPPPHVYSFELDVLKQNQVNKLPLAGVEFVLFHYHTEGSGNVPMYAVLDADKKISSWTANKAEATTLVTDANGKLNVIGIQANMDYYLEENKALSGYIPLEKPVQIIIDSYTVDSANAISSITYEVDSDSPVTITDGAVSGKIPVTVNNKSGSTLPSTGGVGTTLFYVFGSLMFVGAAVLLVTKKRMAY